MITRTSSPLLPALLAASALVTPFSASAQDNGTKDESFQPDSSEIVVTAQRRDQIARDVPFALTALSAQQLAASGITDTRMLQILTPGLKVDRTGNFTYPALRGVTSSVSGPVMDANVAIYLDGVYQPATTANTFDLPDVERVEVLKGPQGTLFGRNATGGAIMVHTLDPSYDPTGTLTASYGNFNDVVLKGFVSTGLVPDKVAISVAGFYHSADTYYHNIRPGGGKMPGDDSTQFRVKLRLDPVDNLKIVLTGAYGDRTEGVALYGSPLNGNTAGRLLDPNSVIPTRPYDVALNQEFSPQKVKSYDASARIELTLPGGTLSALSAYVERKVRSVIDADYSYAPNGLGINYLVSTFDRYFSQELNYASKLDGPFNFVVGGFYTNGKGGYDPIAIQLPDPTQSITLFSQQKVETVAGFGEGTYAVTDRLSVVGGIRYSWEKRALLGGSAPGINQPNPASLPELGEKSWSSVTPRASLRYALTPRSNVYATWSRGFKSGLFNSSVPFAPAQSVDPETIDAFEIGYKGRVTSTVTLEASAFYYDYRNVQATINTLVNGVPLSLLRNAAGERVYGFEADATWRPSSIFDFRGSISLLDAKWRNFDGAEVNLPCTNVPAPGSACSTVGTPTLTGNTSVPFNASGLQVIRTPKVSGSFTANAHVPAAAGKVDLTGSVYYSSTTSLTLDHRIGQPAYATVDLRAAFTPTDSGFTLSGFVRNLTDHAVLSGAFVTAAADGVSYSPPRTYGIQIDYRF